MPTIETSDLTGAALDWAVAKAGDLPYPHVYAEDGHVIDVTPSTDWSQGGPIIERECMEFDYDEAAQIYTAANGVHAAQGKTHLIAAMRCYVASRLGETVNVPEELT